MSPHTPPIDPDEAAAWLDGVRRWLFGGTPPLAYADSRWPEPPAPPAAYSTAASASRRRNNDTSA